jgi:chemotaxis protein CheZ
MYVWERSDKMAVQRKVFRIEESTRLRALAGAGGEAAARAPLRPDLMAELTALRELIGLNAPAERTAMERARAQIAEAEAYKAELDLIYAAVKRTKADAGVPDIETVCGDRTSRAGRELEAIVEDTERATQAILQAAEEIEQAANTLAAALKSTHDLGLAQDVQERVMQIFEACNFQDLAGQRVASVFAALKAIEDHVVKLLTIWQRVERFEPVAIAEDRNADRRYLNGPKLPGEPGHSTQADIDALFRCA